MFGTRSETDETQIIPTLDAFFDHKIGEPVFMRQEIYNEASSFRSSPYTYLVLERHLIEEGFDVVQPYYILRPQENPTATLTRTHAREICDGTERELIIKMLKDAKDGNSSEGADSAG